MSAAPVAHLPNTPPVNDAVLVLRFTEWECGHHQDRPAPIAVDDAEQAFAIQHAISCAISQPGHVRAQLYGSTQFTGAWDAIYVTDDYVAPAGADRLQWSSRPVVIYGSADLLEDIASDALKEAREARYWRNDGDLTPGWLGTVPLEAGALVTTTLSLEQLAALGEEIFPCPTVLEPAADVLARLREITADFTALDAAAVAASRPAPGASDALDSVAAADEAETTEQGRA